MARRLAWVVRLIATAISYLLVRKDEGLAWVVRLIATSTSYLLVRKDEGWYGGWHGW